MDGNRRWAKQEGKSVLEGYQEGVKRLFEITESSIGLGVKTLTVYAFSTENWKRSDGEIGYLLQIFYQSILNYRNSCIENGVQVDILGDITPFPSFMQEALQELVDATKSQGALKLLLALNYGGRDEIRRATVKIANQVKTGQLLEENITEGLISSYLYTSGVPDPDLLIRTSGEMRISNFLLWQLSYAEIYFTKSLWPEFSVQEFCKAIIAYQKRRRRHGG